jgi:hypothetical protein
LFSVSLSPSLLSLILTVLKVLPSDHKDGPEHSFIKTVKNCLGVLLPPKAKKKKKKKGKKCQLSAGGSLCKPSYLGS